MPKNSKKGKNSRSSKHAVTEERKLEKRGEDEAYALVIKKLGNGRFTVKINLGKEVMGRLAGKMRRGRNKRSNWVDEGSIVLVGLREFEDDKVDITYVYKPDEVRQLKKSGEYIEETDVKYQVKLEEVEPDDCGFDFNDI